MGVGSRGFCCCSHMLFMLPCKNLHACFPPSQRVSPGRLRPLGEPGTDPCKDLKGTKHKNIYIYICRYIYIWVDVKIMIPFRVP